MRRPQTCSSTRCGWRATYQVAASKNGATRTEAQIVGKQQRQHKIGAAVQLLTKPDRLNPIIERSSARERAEITRKVDAQLAALGITKTPEGYSIPGELSERWPQIRAKVERIYEIAGAKELFELAWGEVAESLDRSQLHAKRPFSGVVAIKSRDQVPYPSVDEYAQALFAEPSFGPGQSSPSSLAGAGSSGARRGGVADRIRQFERGGGN